MKNVDSHFKAGRDRAVSVIKWRPDLVMSVPEATGGDKTTLQQTYNTKSRTIGTFRQVDIKKTKVIYKYSSTLNIRGNCSNVPQQEPSKK